MSKMKSNLVQDVIDDKNFEEQLQNYWSQAEVSGNLMAELRSLIIKDFNKSRLGREIHLQQKRNTVISPLELVIGAFVAEYLYAQGHHFSLSLLFAESSQIFPNFERTDHFRFHKNEINEILDAIGVPASLKQSIVCHYHEGRSLLHCFFKASLKKADKSAAPKTEHQTVTNDIKGLHSSLAALIKLVQEMGSAQNPLLDTLLKNLASFNRNLEQLTGAFDKSPENPTGTSAKKVRFTDWVLELTNSEMGKRYLKKLRGLVLRLIHKEKKKLKQKYRTRYKYKKPTNPPVNLQPPPPQIQMRTQSTETDPGITVLPEQAKNLNSLVANKLSSLELEETELKLKLQKLEDKLKHCETQTREMKDAIQQKKAKRKSILVKSHSVDIPTISDPETVIKGMRQRIENLESESEQLFSSFNAYLDKKNQQHRVDELTQAKVTAWQQLQTSRTHFEEAATPKPVIAVSSPLISEQTPTINLSSSTESKKSSPKEYRNPFHEIKLDEILKERNKYGRNVKVGQLASDALRKHFDEVWKPVSKVHDKENQFELPKLRKSSLQQKMQEKSPEIRERIMNETFSRDPKESHSESSKTTISSKIEEKLLKAQEQNQNGTFSGDNVMDSSPNSRKSDNKSREAEEIITSLPPTATEAKVTVINHQQSESSRSVSCDKVVISTGNVSSAASDDFWD